MFHLKNLPSFKLDLSEEARIPTLLDVGSTSAGGAVFTEDPEREQSLAEFGFS